MKFRLLKTHINQKNLTQEQSKTFSSPECSGGDILQYVWHSTSLYCPGVKKKLHIGEKYQYTKKCVNLRFRVYEQISCGSVAYCICTYANTHMHIDMNLYITINRRAKIHEYVNKHPLQNNTVHPLTHAHPTLTWSLYSPEEDTELQGNTKGERGDIVTMMYKAPVSIHLTSCAHKWKPVRIVS